MTAGNVIAAVRSRHGVAVVAGASLAVGFAVAQGTGVRNLGGAVLLLGLAWCVPCWVRRSGARVAVGLTVLFVALFAASHVLTLALGVPAWLSVGAVSVVQAAAAFRLDRGALSPR